MIMRSSKISPLPQEVRGRRGSSRSFTGGIVAFALLISSPLMGEDEGGGDTGSRFSPSPSSPPTRGGEKLPFTHTKVLRETEEFFQS